MAQVAAIGETQGWVTMSVSSVSELDALVREEKRLTAVECHSEAWAESLSAGIEPEIVAEAALTTTFAEILRCNGEDATLALLDKMRDKILAGEFDENQTRH